jgi:hypothetical protein
MQALDTLLSLTYDPVAAKSNNDYMRLYNKKLVYIVISIIEKNKSITVNQVCGLLRNTLQVPDVLTKNLIQAMLSGNTSVHNLNKIFRAFPTARGAVHLNLIGDTPLLDGWKSALEEEIPELSEYIAPAYQKGPIFKKGD